MKFLKCGIGLALGALVLAFASGAGAQENLDKGKSGAQLFASDCAICHKTTAGLSRGRILGLESFLREHYTASRESAGALAAYIQATDRGPPPAAAKQVKRTPKGDKKGDEKKPEAGKPGDAKSGDAKPAEAMPAEAKPSEAKPSEAKPSEAKPSEPKPSAAKPSESKPSDGAPPDIYKPEKKSD